MEFRTLKEVMYEEPVMGVTVGGRRIEIIGEGVYEGEGEILEKYLYNIVGFKPENGLYFASLKANVWLD